MQVRTAQNLGELLGGDKPTARFARVVGVGQGTVDLIPVGSGTRISTVPLASVGAVKAGDTVIYQELAGKRIATARNSVPMSGDGGSGSNVTVNSITNTTFTGGSMIAHDFLGATWHNMPTISANLFLAGPSAGSAAPTFRAVVISDIQTVADTRYALRTITVSPGAGLAGGGDLTANRTLSVDQSYAFVFTGIHEHQNVVRMQNAQYLEFGYGVGGKDTSAGRMGYGTFTSNTLDIKGGGTTAGQLRIKLWDDVVINRSLVSSATFASGFLGSGWQIDDGILNPGSTSLEIDNASIRGVLRVYELNIHKIRSGTGDYLFAPGGKVKSVTGAGPYTIEFEDDHGFSDSSGVDVARAQKFFATNGGTKLSHISITSVTNLTTVVAALISGDAPEVGFDYVRIGNTTNTSRQGAVYVSASDSGAPFIDIVDGVGGATTADVVTAWSSSSRLRTRLGKLSGITDSYWGTLTKPGGAPEYGIWANSGWFTDVNIKGKLVLGPGLGYRATAYLHVPVTGLGVTAGKLNLSGHLGQRPTVSGPQNVGGGPWSGSTKSLLIEKGVTNLLTNNSFETNTTGVTNNGGTSLTRVSNTPYLAGSWQMRSVTNGAGQGWYYNVDAVTSVSTTYTFSVHLRGTGSVNLFAYQNGSFIAQSATIALTSTWTRYNITFTFATGATRLVGIQQVGAGSTDTEADATQLEAGFYQTSFADTTRAATLLSYSPTNNFSLAAGSFSAWVYFNPGLAVKTIYSGDAAGSLTLYADNGGWAVVRKDVLAVANYAVVPTVATWYHVCVTWAGTAVVLYVNGVQVATGTAGAAFAAPTNLCIGSYTTTSSLQLNGYISDICIHSNTVSADDVKAMKASSGPLSIARSSHELLLTDDGYGQVIANAGGIYATGVSGTSNFMLLNSAQTIYGESFGEGDVMLGDNAASQNNLLYDRSAGELSIRNGGVKRVTATGAGVLSINDGGGNPVFTFDASTGAEFTRYLTLTTSGGIYQGTGTSASPTTGMRIRQSTVSSNGVIEFYNAGNRTMFLRGDTLIQINGGTAFVAERAINFKTSDESIRIGEIYPYTVTNYNVLGNRTVSGVQATTAYWFAMANHTNNGKGEFLLQASKQTAESSFTTPWAYVNGYADYQGNVSRVIISAASQSDGSATCFLDVVASGTTQQVNITADSFNMTGSKNFRIDHPVYPKQKWLSHAATESDERLLIYRRVIDTDNNGDGNVIMPEWFLMINKNITTHPDKPCDVSRANNAFRIKNGPVNDKVVLLIVGERDDDWAKAVPFPVVSDKDGEDIGYLAHWKHKGTKDDMKPRRESGGHSYQPRV